jgi:hypothetical protein
MGPRVSAAALELARTLRALGDSPQGRAVLRGLELALPEAAAQVREVLDNPRAATGQLFARVVADATAERGEVDRALARGIARALGKLGKVRK